MSQDKTQVQQLRTFKRLRKILSIFNLSSAVFSHESRNNICNPIQIKRERVKLRMTMSPTESQEQRIIDHLMSQSKLKPSLASLQRVTSLHASADDDDEREESSRTSNGTRGRKMKTAKNTVVKNYLYVRRKFSQDFLISSCSICFFVRLTKENPLSIESLMKMEISFFSSRRSHRMIAGFLFQTPRNEKEKFPTKKKCKIMAFCRLRKNFFLSSDCKEFFFLFLVVILVREILAVYIHIFAGRSRWNLFSRKKKCTTKCSLCVWRKKVKIARKQKFSVVVLVVISSMYKKNSPSALPEKKKKIP